MPTFTVVLEEDDVNILERMRETVPVEITLTQLIQAIVDSAIDLTIQAMANPDALAALSVRDLVAVQGERMLRKLQDAEVAN